MRLHGRRIYPGVVEGEALVTSMGISFFGGVDPESGVVVERGHELEGQSVAGKILIFPSGKGSTVGSYTLYRLKHNGKAPAAILNAECETIIAVGCIIAEIPCLDRLPIGQLRSGQLLRLDAEARWVKVLQPAAIPGPLCGSEPGTFAEDTMTNRLPGIGRRVLDEGQWTAEAVERLQRLISNLPNGRQDGMPADGGPDWEKWDAWLQSYEGMNWLQMPWFPAEVTFFRRLLAASGYFRDEPGRGVDPYRAQKLHGLRTLEHGLGPLCAQLEAQGELEGERLDAALADLLRAAVWGNQADLSVFPAGEAQPEQHSEDSRATHLLADQAQQAAAYLNSLERSLPRRVDFILDNVGMELAYDLVVTDFLLRHGLAGQVRFFAKPYPTYVSDAMIPDVIETVAALQQNSDPAVRRLGERLQGGLAAGSFTLAVDDFWISPLSGWEMPAELQADLAGSALLVSKGDANYRRWLGDRHWAATTPFEAVCAYRPAPLLALRVLKSEIVAGLAPGRAEQAARADLNWMFSGRWGLIQFCE